MRGLGSSRDGVLRISVGMLAASMFASAVEGNAQPATGGSPSPPVTYIAQGWSDTDRDIFYTTSQGSRLIPYAWFKALRRLDGDESFAADQLQRYGYLRNDRPNNREGLPVGFVVEAASGQLGLTCAACPPGRWNTRRTARLMCCA